MEHNSKVPIRIHERYLQIILRFAKCTPPCEGRGKWIMEYFWLRPTLRVNRKIATTAKQAKSEPIWPGPVAFTRQMAYYERKTRQEIIISRKSPRHVFNVTF